MNAEHESMRLFFAWRVVIALSDDACYDAV